MEISACEFGAKNGDDFPEVLLLSLPIDDFISDKKKTKKALITLRNKIRLFEAAKITKLAIACNTAHIFVSELQSETRIPFISVIDEVVKKVNEARILKVGLLGTPVTINSGLYQNALAKKGIKVAIPPKNEISVIEQIIRNILAGKISRSDRKMIVRISEKLKKQGAKGIILGCTELPLVFPKQFSLIIFDSLAILARALLRDIDHDTITV